MNDFRDFGVPADGSGSGAGRKTLWTIRERGLPALVKPCVSCRSERHRPTGKFRVNANGKLLDVWMLVGCERCDRTAKIPVHERVHVQAVGSGRLLRFQDNDPAMVRALVLDGTLAARAGYRLDWSGTWELETGLPSWEPGGQDQAPLTVFVSFELPAPIRVGNLLTAGLGLSRSAVRDMAASGRIRLPLPVDAKARDDFTFVVGATSYSSPSR